MTSARGLAFTAAQRVIHRIHRDAADVRSPPQPSAAARLADRDVLVIEVADLTDGREALNIDVPNLARRHLHRRQEPFLRDELHSRSSRTRDLSALAGLELDVVDHGA